MRHNAPGSKLIQIKLGRSEPLAAKGITSQEKLDEQRTEQDVAQRDLNTELMKQNLAQIDYQRAEAVLDLRTIRSPLTGLVLDKNLSTGEFVNQEAFIMTLVQLDPLFVEAYVPVAYWGKVTKGLTGTIRPAEPVGGAYSAPVTVVDGVFDAASGTFGVRLELKNPRQRIAGRRALQGRFRRRAGAGAGNGRRPAWRVALRTGIRIAA